MLCRTYIILSRSYVIRLPPVSMHTPTQAVHIECTLAMHPPTQPVHIESSRYLGAENFLFWVVDHKVTEYIGVQYTKNIYCSSIIPWSIYLTNRETHIQIHPTETKAAIISIFCKIFEDIILYFCQCILQCIIHVLNGNLLICKRVSAFITLISLACFIKLKNMSRI